jgi:hypothetical protein
MHLESGARLKPSLTGIKLSLCLAAMVASTAAQETPPIVKVDKGQLQGASNDGVVSYKGVPFAAPPVGDLRWRPPQPPASWTGVRQASEFGADCMQGRFGPPPPPGGLDLRWWLRRRIEFIAQHLGCRVRQTRGRSDRCQLPPGPLRLFRLPRLE